MKHLFIINPVSGSKKAQDYIPFIEEYFKTHATDDTYEIVFTEYERHGVEISRKFVEAGGKRVYTAGGDGSLNEVINGIAGTDCEVGILPAGTGNDFIKVLTDKKDYKDIVRRTIEGEVIKVDAMKIFEDEVYDYSVNILSVGLDAEAAYNSKYFTEKFKITGMASYLLGFAKSLFNKKTSIDIRVTLDKKIIFDGKALIAACTNGRYYGGGFIPVPHTKFDDGIIDICIIKEKSIPFMLKVLPLFMKGKHQNQDGVLFFKGKSISLESKEMPFRVNIEGEIVERSKVDFEIIPKFINMIKPKPL